MKKTLIAFAALSAIAGVAQAQSTVTLYGLLDGNLGSYKTNSVVGAGTVASPASIQNLTQTKIDSAGLNGSRFGFRVSEDLGGGLAAIGNLEAGVNLDTGTSGQGGVLFGRRANVGLSGGFGTVTIGRNSSSYDDVSADNNMMGQTIFDPGQSNNGPATSNFTAINAAAATQAATPSAANLAALNLATANAAGNFLGRTQTWVGYNTRFNNSVKYNTPNFSGFSGSFMYAFGEDKTTAQNASKTASANLKYANGPLLISGGYQSEGAAVNQATGAKPALENTLISVAYDLGVAKIGAGFNNAKYKAVGPTGGDLATQKEYNLSVAMPLGATTISAGYAQSKGNDLGKSSGFGVQALYSLSKRTTLYAGGVSTKNFDNVAANAKAAFPTSNIGRSTTFATGVRHTF